MATIGIPKGTGGASNPPPLAGPKRWRWTREEFHRMSDAGLFGDRHVELIAGEIYEMTRNPPHDTSVTLTVEAMRAAFGPGYLVRDQKTLDLGRRYQPVPDVAVVAGSVRDYARVHPTSAALIVEVSDSSLRIDRAVKAHRYARAGLADYWIVNLVDRQLEVYRDPGPDPARRGRFRYGVVAVVPGGGHASPLARPGIAVAVADLLP